MNSSAKFDEVQQWYHRVVKKPTTKVVTDIWKNNIERVLVPIIDSTEPFPDKLSAIHKTNL